MKKQTGFTLIELMIAIAVFAIMASIAIPNYSSFIQSSRQSSAYNLLVGTISLARTEAVSAARVVTVCISTDQSTCAATTETEWNKGWIVFADINGNGLVDDAVDPAEDDIILRRQPAAEDGIRITSEDFDSFISIAPRGRLRTQGTFVICDATEADENGMALNLWVTGLGRQATDQASDTDTIVEDIAGDNISCSSTTAPTGGGTVSTGGAGGATTGGGTTGGAGSGGSVSD